VLQDENSFTALAIWALENRTDGQLVTVPATDIDGNARHPGDRGESRAPAGAAEDPRSKRECESLPVAFALVDAREGVINPIDVAPRLWT